jgi:hypothetical protein
MFFLEMCPFLLQDYNLPRFPFCRSFFRLPLLEPGLRSNKPLSNYFLPLPPPFRLIARVQFPSSPVALNQSARSRYRAALLSTERLNALTSLIPSNAVSLTARMALSVRLLHQLDDSGIFGFDPRQRQDIFLFTASR